uniref:Uncharacterized protein n=1 Tax=Tetraselmis sp. GSL018 TaxID=582737 RepID=A0A061RC13_9CHLO
MSMKPPPEDSTAGCNPRKGFWYGMLAHGYRQGTTGRKMEPTALIRYALVQEPQLSPRNESLNISHNRQN